MCVCVRQHFVRSKLKYILLSLAPNATISHEFKANENNNIRTTDFFISSFLLPILIAEADRDILDWSGRKPLDYRKQSTSVSASTYSSKYETLQLLAKSAATASTLPLMNLIPSDTNAFGTLKLKRHKRYSTTTGVLGRTQSMMGLSRLSGDEQYHSPIHMHLPSLSPDLDLGKRNQKRYRSILFRKKTNTTPKENVERGDTYYAPNGN